MDKLKANDQNTAKASTGNTITLDDVLNTNSNVKAKIQDADEEGIPLDQQPLKEAHTLLDYNIHELNVCLFLRGGFWLRIPQFQTWAAPRAWLGDGDSGECDCGLVLVANLLFLTQAQADGQTSFSALGCYYARPDGMVDSWRLKYYRPGEDAFFGSVHYHFGQNFDGGCGGRDQISCGFCGSSFYVDCDTCQAATPPLIGLSHGEPRLMSGPRQRFRRPYGGEDEDKDKAKDGDKDGEDKDKDHKNKDSDKDKNKDADEDEVGVTPMRKASRTM